MKCPKMGPRVFEVSRALATDVLQPSDIILCIQSRLRTNRSASLTASIRCERRPPMRSSRAYLGMRATASQLATQVFGNPSRLPRRTSAANPRIVEETGTANTSVRLFVGFLP